MVTEDDVQTLTICEGLVKEGGLCGKMFRSITLEHLNTVSWLDAAKQ